LNHTFESRKDNAVSEIKESVTTRDRLVESACALFGAKGYRDTTIAEICEQAGANIAAVNYHFGGKEALYLEAWRRSFEKSLDAYPPDGGVPDGASPQARLHGRVLSLLRRIMDPANPEFAIFSREMANPSGLLREARRKAIEPLRHEMNLIVRELLGLAATDEQVRFCRMSIMAQCMTLIFREKRRRRREAEQAADISPDGSAVEPEQVERLADHITTFSLAGLREIRRQIEAGHSTFRPVAETGN
jgi:AcrR family transcriptional regulator